MRKEKEGGPAKLDRLIFLKNIADTADERRFGRIEALEGLNGDGTRSRGQRTQSVLNRLILVFTVRGGQAEVMAQESEDILGIFYPLREIVPLVGAVHGEAGSLPLILLGVAVGYGSPHDDLEKAVALGSDSVHRERSKEFHSFKGTVDLVGKEDGSPERPQKLLVDPVDLREFVNFTAPGRLSFVL